ncbi:DNA mismatch repair endonuclease MutL [Orbaceae bacterium ac157xtp]
MPICILPPQLANQIAAGEVVERPASVIKELVENCLDAGATRIDIDIEQGGCKLMRIRDNGCGINKDEIGLALARHATSKISTLDDLEAIMSLGFRGEALASISSVSRLTLTSKTAEQNEAWQVYAEGRDMAPIIQPASHPTGTTVEVLDLFYNTPARRRFLKTEKTEFGHIDEVLRRIALAKPEVTINLQHNGKLVRQYRATQESESLDNRIASICGTPFIHKAIKLDWEHDDLTIQGWVSPNCGQDIQYFYVNGRAVKDRLIIHALKQAFAEHNQEKQANSGDSLSYVIYLKLDPHQVDVNVHPAKHEVRFHEARLVHDFIHQALAMALSRLYQTQDLLKEVTNPKQADTVDDNDIGNLKINRAAAGHNIYHATPKQNLVPPLQYPYAEYKKPNHVQENKAYGQLIDSVYEPASLPVDESISTEQKAVIDSLFPKRTEPLIPPNKLTLSNVMTLGKVLTVIDNQFVLLEKQDELKQNLYVLSLPKAQLALFKGRLNYSRKDQYVEKLLIPLSILLSNKEQKLVERVKVILVKYNIVFTIEKSKLFLNGVPQQLRKANWQQLLPKLLALIAQNVDSPEFEHILVEWLTQQYRLNVQPQNMLWSVSKAIQFMSELEQLDEHDLNLDELMLPVDLTSILEKFK